ncbi:MGMT family protein [Pedobacter xixiisoli]|uniref:Methylated-DNA-protein-cysteine methyltransferase related protein n=1 Tax=Pedobacter xixiisoli TaxID=1476464 RepID=A0A285ZWI3_9SPHI|nr:MGMT family protein [Pedobacter xixiisoli]SOD13996.1 methylated-DNA-protein-cysteine methyltransferase related protein [Pedobacter xixiisoli]
MEMPEHDAPTFYEQVYELVKLIPKGRITTYGAIAKALGAGKSSRLVGTALIAAHRPNLQLPIHRVVNRNGLLTGKNHYSHPSMQELLEAEGIKVITDQVQHFKEVFWDPLKEI